MKSLLLVSVCSLVSCAVSTSHDEKHEDTNMSYEFDLNGCSTGKQTFASKAEYCQGLLDNSRNHNCARSMREEAYKSACGELPKSN